jgi:hypothetical protein
MKSMTFEELGVGSFFVFNVLSDFWLLLMKKNSINTAISMLGGTLAECRPDEEIIKISFDEKTLIANLTS